MKISDKNAMEAFVEECRKDGVNPYEACREAKVPSSTVFNWKNKEPGAFNTLRKLNKAKDKLKKSKK